MYSEKEDPLIFKVIPHVGLFEGNPNGNFPKSDRIARGGAPQLPRAGTLRGAALQLALAAGGEALGAEEPAAGAARS